MECRAFRFGNLYVHKNTEACLKGQCTNHERTVFQKHAHLKIHTVENDHKHALVNTKMRKDVHTLEECVHQCIPDKAMEKTNSHFLYAREKYSMKTGKNKVRKKVRILKKTGKKSFWTFG